MNLGFIGTGTIAEAVTDGICKAWGTAHEVLVSPRSERIATALAARHPAVTRAISNQQVVDASDIVFLGVRPEQLAAVVAPLAFRDGQIVASFLAGTSVEAVRRVVGSGVRVCRVTPLPMIADLAGPVVLQDAPPEVRALFAPLGQVIEARSAEEMAVFGVGSALMSGFLAWSATASGWLADRGVPDAAARDYVMSMFGALCGTALGADPARLRDLIPAHETPGGINEHCREFLEQAGVFETLRQAMTSTAGHSARLGD